MEGRKIYIYALTDPRDGIVRYIGQTVEPSHRRAKHVYKNAGTPKCQWIQGLKSEGLRVDLSILEVVESELADEADDRERRWIARAQMFGCDLLNRHSGGRRGFEVAEESGRKISERNIGKHSGSKHSGSKPGKRGPKHSQESKRRIGETSKRTMSNPEIKQRVREGHRRWVAARRAAREAAKADKSE